MHLETISLLLYILAVTIASPVLGLATHAASLEIGYNFPQFLFMLFQIALKDKIETETFLKIVLL